MYTIRIEKSALKYINKLDKIMAKRIRDAIDLIAENPGIGKPLTNHEVAYSYRVGGYRILYDKYNDDLIVVIVKVIGRGNVYNN